jgi:hypothetical protein
MRVAAKSETAEPASRRVMTMGSVTPHSIRKERWNVCKLAVSAVLALFGATVALAASAKSDFGLHTVSSRPDMVTGPDVLVEVDAPPQVAWRVRLDGRDVTAAFRAAAGSGKARALLSGIHVGENRLELRIGGAVRARLTILDHSLTGPLFSGPHQQPFLCQTADNGLGAALDSECTAKPLVSYYYKSTEAPSQKPEDKDPPQSTTPSPLPPGFKPYDPTSPLPPDVAKTVTSGGVTVNYIIRREIGTLNRGVYDIEFLHDPDQPLSSPWSRSTSGWNGRLVYDFGPGCAAGYRQGLLGAGETLQQSLLAAGYALATSTLNNFDVGCNDRVSAETLSLVKEYFIKQFGEPIHTIGQGGSGGSVQLYLIAQNYPGLLDGILPAESFPDITTTAESTSDCPLLEHAIKASKLPWSQAQRTAISGFATWNTCGNWSLDPIPISDPKRCDEALPKKLVFDRADNPQGARCDIYDNEVNVFGRSSRTETAYRPLDNVGVQYGLIAFNHGIIDAEQFVELNERVGGYDADGELAPSRTEAEPEAIRFAYDHGLVLTGAGGLSQVPIIDFDWWYSDDLADVHDHFRSLVTRARLIAANGSADNQVILVYPRPNIFPFLSAKLAGDYFQTLSARGLELVMKMDQWLDRVEADRAPGTRPGKIVRNKPADLVDSCIATGGEKFIEEARYDGAGTCNQLYPPHADPRLAAGSPLTDDVLKCVLKPVALSDYVHALSPDQFARLTVAFPSGVCDYQRPGFAKKVAITTWQRF